MLLAQHLPKNASGPIQPAPPPLESGVDLAGPEDIEFRIRPYDEGYVWTIYNGSLRSMKRLWLEIISVCSFDSKKLAFREPQDFKVQWTRVVDLPPGDVTKNSIFFRFENPDLRFGTTNSMGQLRWPSGDPSADRRWILCIRVVWESSEWPIKLDLRWTTDTKIASLIDVSSALERSSVANTETQELAGEASERAVKELSASIAGEQESRHAEVSPIAQTSPYSAIDAKRARAMTVAKLIKELHCLKPQMFEDESEYNRLRNQYRDFLAFKIVEDRPDLKRRVLAIQGSRRHVRLAQELAAAHHERQLSTILDDWKDHKPAEFKRQK